MLRACADCALHGMRGHEHGVPHQFCRGAVVSRALHLLGFAAKLCLLLFACCGCFLAPLATVDTRTHNTQCTHARAALTFIALNLPPFRLPGGECAHTFHFQFQSQKRAHHTLKHAQGRPDLHRAQPAALPAAGRGAVQGAAGFQTGPRQSGEGKTQHSLEGEEVYTRQLVSCHCVTLVCNRTRAAGASSPGTLHTRYAQPWTALPSGFSNRWRGDR